ncbi:hypothetical protein ACIP5Z_11445 [Rothia terrae]|uniref:hypothetical protein n=1 Tax=Rothia terrae TaxID=396015 RepID=UPI003803DD9C
MKISWISTAVAVAVFVMMPMSASNAANREIANSLESYKTISLNEPVYSATVFSSISDIFSCKIHPESFWCRH